MVSKHLPGQGLQSYQMVQLKNLNALQSLLGCGMQCTMSEGKMSRLDRFRGQAEGTLAAIMGKLGGSKREMDKLTGQY